MAKGKTTVKFTAHLETGRPRSITVKQSEGGWTAHGRTDVYETPRGAAMSVAREFGDLMELRSEHQRESAAEARATTLGYLVASSLWMAHAQNPEAGASVLWAAGIDRAALAKFDLCEFDTEHLEPCMARLEAREAERKAERDERAAEMQ